MEYRFFYSINEDIMNTKWKTRFDGEHRTDIYFIIPAIINNSDDFHLEYGLKLRNKKTLELKIRKTRFSNGQENWLKTIHSNKKLHIDDMISILNILKLSNENQLIERLTSSQPIILCYATKFREQTRIGDNHKQELTGLHLKFIRSNDQSQIGSDLFFETVCIERPDSKLIDEKIIEKLSQQYRTIPINSMGYPEFLYRQYQQTINK
ncbi:unnamed protein product [Rotaria sordida]|uniref:VTC domain-containing protein n=1 Tax=Rotaria sordida TaxID=392033 RepID=A0A814T7M6_9BILA|nr:unnamed protein product [Rotaria sordida]CAF3725632.1 unnamed protein product [Rotaria sordida]